MSKAGALEQPKLLAHNVLRLAQRNPCHSQFARPAETCSVPVGRSRSTNRPPKSSASGSNHSRPDSIGVNPRFPLVVAGLPTVPPVGPKVSHVVLPVGSDLSALICVHPRFIIPTNSRAFLHFGESPRDNCSDSPQLILSIGRSASHSTTARRHNARSTATPTDG